MLAWQDGVLFENGVDEMRNIQVPKHLDLGVFGARGIPSTYSGYETFLTVLLPELTARGHQVTMYCRSGEVEQASWYQGVKKVFLPAIASKQLSTLSHGALAALATRHAQHDVVLVVNVANAGFCLLSRLTGQRIVLNADGQEWLRGKWGRAARAYFRGSARIARWSASALIADGIGMRDIYEQQFKAESTVIPYCWTEIDHEERLEALDSLGVSPYGYFLIAGRLIPENNIHRVACSYLASDARTPLVVLGAANYDSPVTRELRELANKDSRLILGGHIADRTAYATMVRLARAYFHAHSVGGINPSLLEAMGCGARIIALETVFNREALGGAGEYFSDFDDELPTLMRRLDGVSTADDELRAFAIKRANGRFSLERVADAYERLLMTVACSPRWRRTVLEMQWSKSETFRSNREAFE
jgi:glycosyltransferase involved in cell wall biosynthesis